MLGSGVADARPTSDARVDLTFTNDEAIRTLAEHGVIRAKAFVHGAEFVLDAAQQTQYYISRMITICCWTIGMLAFSSSRPAMAFT